MRSVHLKYDGSLHWHTSLLWLGVDEHGTWLGSPAGGVSQRGHEPAITLGYAYATLVPADAWWTAIMNSPGQLRTAIYCDVTTVPVWEETAQGLTLTVVDLDLDVIRRRDGSTLVDDEDEFAEHQVKYAYPPQIINAAEASCAWLFEAVTARRAPFDEATSEPWIDRIPAAWPS